MGKGRWIIGWTALVSLLSLGCSIKTSAQDGPRVERLALALAEAPPWTEIIPDDRVKRQALEAVLTQLYAENTETIKRVVTSFVKQWVNEDNKVDEISKLYLLYHAIFRIPRSLRSNAVAFTDTSFSDMNHDESDPWLVEVTNGKVTIVDFVVSFSGQPFDPIKTLDELEEKYGRRELVGES